MKKSTKILLGALVLLGVIYAIQRVTYTTSTTENSNPFSKLDTSKVDKISISGMSAGKDIVIVRESHGWFITNPLHFSANRSQVNLLLSAIASNPSASVVADNLTDSLAYGLSANAPVLTVSENNQKEISLRIGNVTPDFDGCYVEIKGANKILDLTKNVRTYVAQSLSNWRDKQIFDFTLENVQAADFAIGDTLYHFLHRDTLWQVDGQDVPLTKIQDLIGDFVGTTSIDFVDTSLSDEKPLVDFEFSLANGMREAGKVTRLAGQTLISNSANGQTYVIGSLIADNLERGLREIYQDYLNKETLKR